MYYLRTLSLTSPFGYDRFTLLNITRSQKNKQQIFYVQVIAGDVVCMQSYWCTMHPMQLSARGRTETNSVRLPHFVTGNKLTKLASDESIGACAFVEGRTALMAEFGF